MVEIEGKQTAIMMSVPKPRQNSLIVLYDEEEEKAGEVWYNPGQGLLWEGDLEPSAIALFEVLKPHIDEYISKK